MAIGSFWTLGGTAGDQVWLLVGLRSLSKRFAACDGDVHGALEALLLVNEHLEAELRQLSAAVCPTHYRDQCFTIHE